MRTQPVADLFAVVEHWRFVFFALADDDHAAHRHRGDELAHRVDGGTVAAFLVAAAHPAAGRHRAGLGDSHQLQGQVAIRAHIKRGVQWGSHGGAFLEWQGWRSQSRAGQIVLQRITTPPGGEACSLHGWGSLDSRVEVTTSRWFVAPQP